MGSDGQRADERAALEWLEARAPPEIAHGAHWPRNRATVYVPPNIEKPGNYQIKLAQVLPSRRLRQPWACLAVRPNDGRTSVSVIWAESDPDAAVFTA